jgi:hypothetical protein
VTYPRRDDPQKLAAKLKSPRSSLEMSTEIIKKTKAPAKPRKATTKAKTTKTATESVETALPPIVVPTHEEIAILAEQFWVERGRQDGEAEHDWLRAEAQLVARAS